MRIFVQFDLETEQFELMCESHNRVAPAGPRIFRAPPHPRVNFRHETLHAAEEDASKVRSYLATLNKRSVSKQELRKTHA